MKRVLHSVTKVTLLLGIAVMSSGAQTTASGTLDVTLANKDGLVLTFASDPAGVPLGNSGSFNATMDFGTLSKLSTPGTGITKTTTATSWTISSPFQVRVAQNGAPSPNNTFQLVVNLANTCPAGLTYMIQQGAGAKLSLCAGQQTFANNAYGAIQHTLTIQIQDTVAGNTSLANTLNFVATAQ